MPIVMQHPLEVSIQPMTVIDPLADRTLDTAVPESISTRRVCLIAMIIFLLIYAWRTFSYFAPADGGVDQNAYLLGGRMLAEHFSTRFTLPNPYAYVGGMMIRTSPANVPGGDYYPKYPLGLPLLYACFFWLFGATHAASWAFIVSPVSSILAVGGMFLLARRLTGSFAALMAAILLGCSQLMIELSNNPNSHASCTALVVWGMYQLIRWWQGGHLWRGLLAGFLLGYACLIRYSEGLLILPIAVVCLSRLRWTHWKSYLRCALPGLAWAVPVAILLFYNKHSMGNWTGYDSTNESEGFTWLKFTQTWEQMLRTYYDTGAFFVLPIGLMGIALAFARNWRFGLMLLAWLLPGTSLYTAYYWSPDSGISYARFFLTFLPAIMLGTAICFSDGIAAVARDAPWRLKAPRIAAVLLITGISAGLGVYRSVHGLQQGRGGGFGGMQPLAEQTRVRKNLANLGDVLLRHVPVNAVLFTDNSGGGQNERPLNYIQFLRHWDTYSTDAFDSNRRGMMGGFNGLANNIGLGAAPDPNPVPTTRQKLQMEYEAFLSGKTYSDRHAEQLKVIDGAIKDGRGVYALASVADDSEVRRTFNLAGKYQFTVVETWSDLPPLPADPVAENAGSTTGRRPGGMFGGGGGNGRRGNPNANAGRRGAAPTTDIGIKWELLQVTKP